ncbi:unnamed protein product [Phaedon cochleariae]|uniref:Uncharacterized protein n=1 Tax=Phaedon cochleariae TaxID=80249 RepID=A0A9N9SGP2_PHACE|nr:unnamed protein product [Phaedon cochleariae]
MVSTKRFVKTAHDDLGHFGVEKTLKKAIGFHECALMSKNDYDEAKSYEKTLSGEDSSDTLDKQTKIGSRKRKNVRNSDFVSGDSSSLSGEESCTLPPLPKNPKLSDPKRDDSTTSLVTSEQMIRDIGGEKEDSFNTSSTISITEEILADVDRIIMPPPSTAGTLRPIQDVQLENYNQQEVEKRVAIEEKYQELAVKYEQLEKSQRKNNIVIFGLDFSEDKNTVDTSFDKKRKLLNFTIEKLNQSLGINLSASDINDIFTIGKQDKDRPIILKFCSFYKKQEVLSNCKKLKGTNIRISIELNYQERLKNREWTNLLIKARTKYTKVYIRRGKFFVDEEEYSFEDLKQLLGVESEEHVEATGSTVNTRGTENGDLEEIELEQDETNLEKTIVGVDEYHKSDDSFETIEDSTEDNKKRKTSTKKKSSSRIASKKPKNIHN